MVFIFTFTELILVGEKIKARNRFMSNLHLPRIAIGNDVNILFMEFLEIECQTCFLWLCRIFLKHESKNQNL